MISTLFDRYDVSSAVRDFVTKPHGLLIDGKWREAFAGGVLNVFEPSSGQLLTTVAAAGVDDVAAAVVSARAAFDDRRWSGKSPSEREEILYRLVTLLDADADFLATVESIDNGQPISAASQINIPDAIRFARYMAGWPTKITGRTMPLATADTLGLTFREPVGVVAAITPWNLPFNLAIQKVMSALAAGCTIVLKPAELTPLTALRLGELALEAGVPEGALNVLTGTGALAGEALVRHPLVSKISFTGSTKVGRHIGKLAMDNMSRLTLELGGKSPMIVMPDCDLDATAQGVIDAIFFNAGQVCCAASRLYVHEDVEWDLLERVTAKVAALKIGPGLDPSTDLGPLVSAAQRDRVSSYIEMGLGEGGRLVAGGKWDGNGYFIPATILQGLAPSSAIMTEEIFGPVLAAATFRSVDEALRLAQDTRYGLAASIWSNDLASIKQMAAEVRAGTIWVNAHNPVDPALPFGGYGMSGFGREGGEETLDAYLETKSLWIA